MVTGNYTYQSLRAERRTMLRGELDRAKQHLDYLKQELPKTEAKIKRLEKELDDHQRNTDTQVTSQQDR